MIDEEDIDIRNSTRPPYKMYDFTAEFERAASHELEEWRKKREVMQKKWETEKLNIWKDIVDDDEAYR